MDIKQIVVFPGGTYDDYYRRNMLDQIPENAEITRYDEYNLDCIASSVAVHLHVIYADEKVERMDGYDLPANSKVTEL